MCPQPSFQNGTARWTPGSCVVLDRHRYSCSELSDADSNSQVAADDEYQLGIDELDAIHSASKSIEDGQSLRKLLSSSSSGSCSKQQDGGLCMSKNKQQQQQQQQLGVLRASGGMYGRPSLTPVKEEQPEQVCRSLLAVYTLHTTSIFTQHQLAAVGS